MRDKTILVVDDDLNIRKMAEHIFAKEGARVFTASNGLDGLRKFYAHKPDLIILDIMMPEEDGWETCRNIRKFSDVPIIILTALKTDEDITRGLNYGADDFVTKPFSPGVLLARARAVLRRTETFTTGDKPFIYSDSYLTIDLDARRVIISGQPVKLTPIEFQLLAYLVKNPGRVLSLQQILENVWGWEYQDSLEYVHVYIYHLRKKIEEDPKQPKYIMTEHGIGYRFEKQYP
jgi:two-component system KDP operon response regulator KdpE